MKPSCLVLYILLSSASAGELTEQNEWKCEEYEEDYLIQEYICDGYPQCGDESDESREEGQGCNLFPDSGCPSVRGREHFLCHRSGDCFDTLAEATECENSSGPPVRECELEDGVTGFKCKDGLCISSLSVCDGSEECEDGTDESTAAYGGCNLFPNDTDSCDSIGAERHHQCPADQTVCVPESLLVMAEFNSSDPNSCRLCKERTEWRCDDGRCINSTFHRDGRPHCWDYSDEVPFNIYWYYILSSTVGIVITGICGSLLCRHLRHRNIMTCRSDKSEKSSSVRHNAPVEAGDTVDAPIEFEDEYPDIPCELIELLEDTGNWLKDEEGNPSKTLKPEVLKEAVKKYVYIYTDPIQYHNLYMYFAHRYSTLENLNRIVKYLYDWEGDIHGENRNEIIKSWRLHLGISSMTEKIMDSIAHTKSFDDQVNEAVDPARRFLRKWRRNILQLKPLEDGLFYKSLSIIYFSLVPVIEGSFFYFERFKNLIYIHIFYSALNDLSKDDPLKHTFEFSLVLFMGLAVGLVQLINILFSAYYAEDIMDIGHQKNDKKFTLNKILYKVLAVVLSPFFPIVVLANHVFYESKTSRLRRHLQEGDEEIEISATIRTKVRNKVILYQRITEAERQSMLYRKLYSYYRVVSAVLESCTVLVCLLLLLFVTGRPGREINLIAGVENKLYSFFDVQVSNTSGLLAQLNIMRDIVIFGSIFYSVIVILTALVKYWYQSLNLGISFKGQVCLGLYLLCLTANKITTAVSLFATTEPLKYDDGTREPKITLFAAVVIFGCLFLLRLCLVYVYKRWFSAGRNGCQDDRRIKAKLGWDSGSFVDKLINVIVNCVVVTPFMAQKEPIKELKRIQKEFGSKKTLSMKKSLKRRTSVLKLVPQDDERGNQVMVVENLAGLFVPKMDFFVDAMLYDDLRNGIRRIWWEDPTTKLDFDNVKKKLFENNNNLRLRLLTLKEEDVDKNIRSTLKTLEEWSMVNCPLLNPVQTKREYFWLFLIVVLENLIALGIEVGNGGVWSSQGHYYSWDIRLATFSFAVLFLMMYYKRFHLTREVIVSPNCGGWLNFLPICLCCAQDTPMKAMENEEAMENVISEVDSKKKRETSTQTDFDVYSKFPPQTGNNGTEEQMRQFHELHGRNSSFNLRKTVSKMFNYPKTQRSISTTSYESQPITAVPLALPESLTSSSHNNKTDADLEMSVRQPLMNQMDQKLDNEDNQKEKRGLGYRDSFMAAGTNSEGQVEVTAVLHSN